METIKTLKLKYCKDEIDVIVEEEVTTQRGGGAPKSSGNSARFNNYLI